MQEKKLSVIIPVYNEEKHLEKVIRYLFNSACPIEREWIIVDDCSQDKSKEILLSLQQEFKFKFIPLAKNMGKGAAISGAISHATGDYIMIQDADFEYDPSDVPDLLAPLLSNKADVVYGSRFKKNSIQVHRTYHYFVNRFLTILSNLMSGIYLTDMETCYKIFKSDLLKSMNLSSKRFGIEIELTAYLSKTKARICELPISYYPRTRLQGKKINWKDGVAALWHLLIYNFFIKKEDMFSKLPDQYSQTGTSHFYSQSEY